jgi:uncharacterized protein with PQ loop repeat
MPVVFLVRVLIMLASVCAALGLVISLSSEINEMIKIMQSQNDKSINFTFFFTQIVIAANCKSLFAC